MRRATVLATVVVALGALGAPAMAVAPGAVPDQGAASLDRINGDTRFDTAALTALRAYPDGAETVLVATGLNFPDALAASFLAGGTVDAPILLVEREAVPAETRDAIEQLDPANVVVLGGSDAVADATVQELRDLRGEDNVEVIGGATRIETAAMIARQGGQVGTAPDLGDPASDADLTTAIVARADDFPDALAAGPLALEGRHPILLTDTATLDATTRDVLTDPSLGIEQVIIPGGPVAVSEDVETAIAALDNVVSVHRVQGENRTATAVELADLTRTTRGWGATNLSLARGDFFPDALTIAPLAAQLDASLLLSQDPETIGGDTFAGIQSVCDQVEEVLITGGPVAVSPDAAGEAKLASICADHTFPISWEQEVDDEGDQAGLPGAEGTGWVTVDGATVCTAYDVEGLGGTADASHIHQGDEGTNGDVVMDLGAPNANGFLATCDDDAEVAAALEVAPSNHYVNIHTPDFAMGAARGQIAASPVDQPASEFMVFGDAVPGETEETGLVGDAQLSVQAGQVCLDLTGLEATDATTAEVFAGAVDQEAQGDALATFDLTADEVCDDISDPSLLFGDGDALHLSVTTTAGDELARGQLEATQEAELVDGDAQVQGAAFLYRGADATTLCGAIDLGELTANGDVTVTDDADGEVAVLAQAELAQSVDFACDDSATEQDAASITVPTADGELTGQFGAGI